VLVDVVLGALEVLGWLVTCFWDEHAARLVNSASARTAVILYRWCMASPQTRAPSGTSCSLFPRVRSAARTSPQRLLEDERPRMYILEYEPAGWCCISTAVMVRIPAGTAAEAELEGAGSCHLEHETIG